MRCALALQVNYPENQPAALNVRLARPPAFYKETSPEPRKHTIWHPTTDFTGGEVCRFAAPLLCSPDRSQTCASLTHPMAFWIPPLLMARIALPGVVARAALSSGTAWNDEQAPDQSSPLRRPPQSALGEPAPLSLSQVPTRSESDASSWDDPRSRGEDRFRGPERSGLRAPTRRRRQPPGHRRARLHASFARGVTEARPSK
mmetsp:Transcript_18614/g.40776  ORF Transcript_18614/g.40776 Transcript_18614/m.40776 type:complete len:202 (-) Transcript_18614:1028-1633(-)